MYPFARCIYIMLFLMPVSLLPMNPKKSVYSTECAMRIFLETQKALVSHSFSSIEHKPLKTYVSKIHADPSLDKALKTFWHVKVENLPLENRSDQFINAVETLATFVKEESTQLFDDKGTRRLSNPIRTKPPTRKLETQDPLTLKCVELAAKSKADTTLNPTDQDGNNSKTKHPTFDEQWYQLTPHELVGIAAFDTPEWMNQKKPLDSKISAEHKELSSIFVLREKLRQAWHDSDGEGDVVENWYE